MTHCCQTMRRMTAFLIHHNQSQRREKEGRREKQILKSETNLKQCTIDIRIQQQLENASIAAMKVDILNKMGVR